MVALLEEEKERLKKGIAAFLRILKDERVPTPELYEVYYRETTDTSDEEFLNLLRESVELLSRFVSLSLKGELDRLQRLAREAQEIVSRLQSFYFEVDFLSEELFRDYLTGAWNRRALEFYFSKFVKPNVILEPFTLSFFDLNNFKEINDRLGHLAGDKAIQTFCSFLEERFTPHFVCRYGGDEFVLITGGLPFPKVRELLEEALNSPPECCGRELSFAVGFTPVVGSDTLERVLERADRAMYRSKISGKVEYERV